MVDDGARLRLPSADQATSVYTAELDLDLGNLLASDSRGPDPSAFQVRRRGRRVAPPQADTRAAQEEATAACIAHGRDVLQRLIVRVQPFGYCAAS